MNIDLLPLECYYERKGNKMNKAQQRVFIALKKVKLKEKIENEEERLPMLIFQAKKFCEEQYVPALNNYKMLSFKNNILKQKVYFPYMLCDVALSLLKKDENNKLNFSNIIWSLPLLPLSFAFALASSVVLSPILITDTVGYFVNKSNVKNEYINAKKVLMKNQEEIENLKIEIDIMKKEYNSFLLQEKEMKNQKEANNNIKIISTTKNLETPNLGKNEQNEKI